MGRGTKNIRFVSEQLTSSMEMPDVQPARQAGPPQRPMRLPPLPPAVPSRDI